MDLFVTECKNLLDFLHNRHFIDIFTLNVTQYQLNTFPALAKTLYREFMTAYQRELENNTFKLETLCDKYQDYSIAFLPIVQNVTSAYNKMNPEDKEQTSRYLCNMFNA
jgi:hypothetical protein